MFDEIADRLMMPFIAVVLTIGSLLLCVGLPMLIYTAVQEEQSPTFELRKDQWRPTRSHIEYPSRTVVDEWTRVR